jgi:hypothetical protein
MSDAWLHRQGKHNSLAMENTNPDFLDHLQEKFGILANGIAVSRKAQENNENLAKQFGGEPEDYDADGIYNLTFVSHPFFDNFESWYTNDGKVWPEDIELTKESFRYWYAGDGNLYKADDKRPIIEIACSNEIAREDFITSLFEGIQVSPSFAGHKIRFGVDESEFLLNWCEVVPGFEYKWDS